MVSKENIGLLVDSTKENLVTSGKSYLQNRKGQLTQSFQSAQIEIINKLKNDVQDLAKQLNEIYIKSEQEKNKILKNLSLNDEEKQNKIGDINEAVAFEQELLNLEIEIKKQELVNLVKAYLPSKIKDYQSNKKAVVDAFIAKKTYVKNAIKFKPSYTDVVITVGILANLILSQITIGNKKIENLVDKILDIINNIETQEDVIKARLLVNNAKSIINDNRKKLQTIDGILNVIEILIPILKALLTLFKIIPIPTTFTTIGITNTAAAIQKKVDDILLTATTILNITQSLVRKMIDELNYQESRLRPIDDILTQDLINLSSQEIENLLNSNNNGITDKNLNGGGNIGEGINGETSNVGNNNRGSGLIDIDSKYNNGLGYLDGYDYKGFRFYILEENNSKFIVKGNKRRYGVAKNKIGVDVLQSEYSFTLSPEVLVEELKLQIDQKGLVS
jgi:hypothetical protein